MNTYSVRSGLVLLCLVALACSEKRSPANHNGAAGPTVADAAAVDVHVASADALVADVGAATGIVDTAVVPVERDAVVPEAAPTPLVDLGSVDVEGTPETAAPVTDVRVVVAEASDSVSDASIDASVDVPDMASSGTPAAFMRALLLGQTQHAGTRVRFSGVATVAITEADGRFALPNPSDGIYEALFDNGEYQERIPQLTVRGGLTFVKDRNGNEQAFPTVELPRAHRIHDGDNRSFQFDISPSGSRLLLWQSLAANTSRLSLLTGDARSGTVVATGTLGVGTFLDEDRLLVTRASNGPSGPWSYQSMPATGGAETLVLTAAAFHYPRFVLDRTKVLYWIWTRGPALPALTLARANGTDSITLGNGAFESPLVSPDGNWVAFRTQDAPANQLRLTDLRDGSTRVVAGGLGEFFDYAFTPDSQRLVYQVGTIFSVRVDGGNPIALGRGDDHMLSPEGSLVLFQSHYTRPLAVVPVEGGTPLDITVDTPTSSLTSHSFSTDDRYVFFETSNALKAASTSGLDVQILTTDQNADVVGYSPIGHTVFFTGMSVQGTTRLYRMPLDRSGSREVLAARVGDAWTTPRGRYLFFSKLDEVAPSLGLVDLQSGQTRNFHSGAGRPLFSADEAQLLFSGGGKVWVGKTSDGTQVAVGDGRFFFPDGFSPDGSRVTYFADQVFTAAATDGSLATPIARWVNPGTRWMGNRQVVFPSGPFADPPPFTDGFYVAPVP